MTFRFSRLSTAAAMIALGIVVLFALSVPRTHELPVPPREAVTAANVPVVELHDAYKKGTHTLTGAVTAPNACSSVTAQAVLAGDASKTQSIQLALSLSNGTGVCLELPTRITFSTALSVPAGLPISTSVNGVAASTTP